MVGLALCALPAAFAVGTKAQQPDVTAVAAAARKALGGDAALAAISTLTVSGSISGTLVPGGVTATFDTTWMAPDRVLRIMRRTSGPPAMPIEVTYYDGFSGDRVIYDIVSRDVRTPFGAPLPPELQASREAAQLNRARRMMIELYLPLFASPPSSLGLELAGAGKVAVNGVMSDVIDVKQANGPTLRLLLDERTHLPMQLTWRAKPVISSSASGSSTTPITPGRSGGGGGGVAVPRTVPLPGIPTPEIADVDWVITLEDYRISDGLNWPRRFKKSSDGQVWEDIRVSKYLINPKVDPKLFEPRKGTRLEKEPGSRKNPAQR